VAQHKLIHAFVVTHNLLSLAVVLRVFKVKILHPEMVKVVNQVFTRGFIWKIASKGSHQEKHSGQVIILFFRNRGKCVVDSAVEWIDCLCSGVEVPAISLFVVLLPLQNLA